ncbi:Peptidoglycan/xylan/chitin deacetylase, PgdA/CDA1 family [Algoriphagus alkaliphilus]|uniref:Peptidoglycan/xylan/chitin deacetylase, PgdA/CDA1 family n=1 Tax=Algoriphagus alkaliphilus TaxID=279824 RepID=A0A1G5YTK0_9BACT|nr:polysaccharide deacetylase family protein [Algoriphagus alkaliphilus]SDA85846.1 Peptidoglycan/xylan/chitin deacetylase, PgdA/CDA1 family [Algoriphagus alkaliphilus]
MVWHTVPRAVQLLFPKRVWKGDSSDKRVYLTFDDGPVPGVTDFVLNELAIRDQKATFFMVGDNLQKFPKLGNEVLEQGHRIGNHTHNHLNGWKTNDAVYLKNIQAFDQVLDTTLGVKTQLFRPPYGLMRDSQAKAVMQSKDVVMWNVLSGDFDLSIEPSRLLTKSIQNTRSGSIILFHDQQKTKEILRKLLPDFLDFLGSNGFKTSLL